MKDPAFLFYTNDFYSGISDLTMEERGQYITLLCLQHLKGHLSEKTIQLAVGKATEDVLKKFTLDEQGLFFNKRLDYEINKRAEYAEKQRDRINKRWNKNNTTVNTTVLPKIVNENVNENKDEIKDKNEKQKIEIPTLEEFLNYLQIEMPNWGFDFNSNKFYLQTKYETWVSNGWKDGNGNKIKSWKLKAKNQMPYLPNSKPIIAKSDGIYADINKNYKQL